jgi:hypothetical protein
MLRAYLSPSLITSAPSDTRAKRAFSQHCTRDLSAACSVRSRAVRRRTGRSTSLERARPSEPAGSNAADVSRI